MNNSIYLVSTKQLSEIFNMSERRVLQLVEDGIIEDMPETGHAKQFDLAEVVPQYANYLMIRAANGITAKEWAPITKE